MEEVEPMLGNAIFVSQRLSAVRYPRGSEFEKPMEFVYTGNNYDFYGNKNAKILIVTYGRIFSNVYFASKKFESICVLKLNVIYPIDIVAVKESLNFKHIIFFEESMLSGGIGEKFGSCLVQEDYQGSYLIKAINDEFVTHATVDSQLKKYNFDIDGIKSEISKLYA